MMKLFFCLLLMPFLAAAQTQTFMEDPSGVKGRGLRAEGQLLSVQIVPGQPLRIYVVGKEEAKINWPDLTVTVRRMQPYPAKVLNIDRYGNYFSVPQSADEKPITELEVTTKLKQKSEVFHFKLKNSKP